MSFTPYGAGGEVTGIPHCKFPPMDPCCANRDRRCASNPFFYSVPFPPWYRCPPKCPTIKKPLNRRFPSDAELWYDKDNDYMHYTLEDTVMPIKGFWHYADSIPDCPHQVADVPQSCLRRENQRPPWPPLPSGACPAPKECQPCGPGPWASPHLRRFFYYDCV